MSLKLSPEQEQAVRPIAEPFNKWLSSLISTLGVGASDDEKRVLNLFDAAHKSVVASGRVTTTLVHFADEAVKSFWSIAGNETLDRATCAKGVSDWMREDPDAFVTDVLPRINLLRTLNITVERLAKYPEAARNSIYEHLEIMADMVEDVEAELHPPIDASALMSMLPPEVAAQLQSSGAFDSVMSKVGGLGLGNLIGDAQGVIAQFKSQFGNVNEESIKSPEQRQTFLKQIGDFITTQATTPGSPVSSLFDSFDAQFPQGLTRDQATAYIHRGKSMLKLFGAEKGDSVWRIYNVCIAAYDKMQNETKSSPFTRATIGGKLTSLVSIILETPNVTGLFYESAMSSPVLQQVFGQFLGVPLEKIAKDPFA